MLAIPLQKPLEQTLVEATHPNPRVGPDPDSDPDLSRAPGPEPRLTPPQVGATVSMMRSLVTLDMSLAGKLRGEQLAKAGRVIVRLRSAGFTDEDAAAVVKALFLSRSRKARRPASRRKGSP